MSHLDVFVCLHSDMKNAVIGNNKQKANLIVLGAVPRYESPRLSHAPALYFLLLAFGKVILMHLHEAVGTWHTYPLVSVPPTK